MAKAKLTHLDKVFWPREGYTKGDVIRYYERVADAILPYLRDRPMVLNRHPNGIRGKSFYQKNVDPKHLPPFVHTIAIRAKSTRRNVHYIVCNNKLALLYLANLGCIELHPWLSRTRHLNKPDYLVIDLDPGRNTFAQVITVARTVRKVIEAAGGHCAVKTSGKTGIHVYVPISAAFDFAEVRAAAKLIVRIINQRLPKLTSLARSPANRKNRVYLDYARNSFGQTIAAPYSLRAYPGATVSTPLGWSELTQNVRPERYTMRTVFRRLNRNGDSWRRDMCHAVNVPRLVRKLQSMDTSKRG
ncbi:MAG: non-homologous end-joining DNA ligase [Rhizomicrobium sp.]